MTPLGKYEAEVKKRRHTIAPYIIDEEDLIVTQVPEQQDNTTVTGLFDLEPRNTCN